VTPTTAATPIPNVIPPASPTAESIFGPILSIPGLDHGRILPSPDGRYVATVASDLLCIHNAKMLQRKNCANLERAGLVGIDVNGVVWSPDSRHLALTEPFAPTGDKGVESDLWRYDIDSATLTDLTIDRIAGKVATLTGEGTSFISATGPAWSPDGQAILFVQSEWNGGWSTTIGRIPANGGAVATVLIVDPDEPMTVPTGSLQVTSEGNIIFTRDRAAPTDPGNGVWQVSIFGSEMTQLLAPPSDATFVPRVVALSPTEQHALVLFPREGKDGQSANAPALLDLQTGSIKLLGLNGGPSSIEGRATMAAFSPDGTALIYVWAPVNDGEQQVVVRMLINGSETVLGSGVETAPTDGHGAWWTTDGMVFLNASNANPRFYRFNPDVTVPRG
jgi:dipeptidyl aminopeptidase/acylaminoacyl peptidase